MTEPNDYAFPFLPSGFKPEYGLTKREWFIGKALEGLLAGDVDDTRTLGEIARISIDAADEVIERVNRLNKQAAS